MRLYRKISRWPHYRGHPEVLEMNGREYSEWYRREVLRSGEPSPTAEYLADRKAAREATPPGELEESRRRARAGIGRVLIGALKWFAVVVAGVFAGIFGLAKKQNPPRDNRM